MTQQWIPAAFIRGGTSKGLFFHERDLPRRAEDRDALFLSALGSPDPYGRQLDGMGGGLSSLSKVMIVERSQRPDADVDYTFGQVSVDQEVVDYASNCGNLSSAVGPFAVDEGLIERPDGHAEVRMYNVNTDKIIVAGFEVRDGMAEVSGSLSVPGVPGEGAPIELKFLDPGGSKTGKLLPTGSAADDLLVAGYREAVSLVDAANPVVFVQARTVGLEGSESPEEIEARAEVMARLDEIRREGGVAMGLGETPASVPLSAPKVAVVAAPQDYATIDGARVAAEDFDVSVRIVSMGRMHRAITGTGALCVAIAAKIHGTTVEALASARPGGSLRIGTPSGVLSVASDVEKAPGGLGCQARSASLFRTSRRLMRGEVAVPEDLRSGSGI